MIHNQSNRNKFIFAILFALISATITVSDIVDAANPIDNIPSINHFPAEICSRDAHMEMLIPVDSDTIPQINPQDVEVLAKLLWGKARGVASDTQKSGVIWCVLNRVDSSDPYYPDTIIGVVEQENQFLGYNADYPVTEELYALAEDVLLRWYEEKDGTENAGRTLPLEFLWFTGDGTINTFTDDFLKGNEWDWSLPSPYED